ncbi:hypothetical protein BOTBODRAFT_127665 [Botryobasidium botryosum FD-172 SS1]|uniref:G domain-containing protein n=1 Tax=Botryobasidium botryosum (strain FD-172 SS1) TaxID=930990 RepID=A0A067MVL2_BOTB1|nr:hypothetical protein BOTBODRAFT_127665 [Botryobasidium botryosum FD-172 SS1]
MRNPPSKTHPAPLPYEPAPTSVAPSINTTVNPTQDPPPLGSSPAPAPPRRTEVTGATSEQQRAPSDSAESHITSSSIIDNTKQEETTIAVMGGTGVGKTSFIKLLSGADINIGDDLISQTGTPEHTCFELNGRRIILIDTPGFNDTNRSDADILNGIASYFSFLYGTMRCRFSAVLYFHRISDNRVTGSSRNNMKMCEAMCGYAAMPNVFLCTTMWDDVDPDIGMARQQELCNTDMFFGGMLKKGAHVARLDNTLESAQALIAQVFKLTPVALAIQRECIDEGKALGDTAAGILVNEEIAKLEAKRLADIAQAEEETKIALAEKDVELQKELEADRQAYAQQIEEMKLQRLVLAQTRQIEQLRLQVADLEAAGYQREGLWEMFKQARRSFSQILQTYLFPGPERPEHRSSRSSRRRQY